MTRVVHLAHPLITQPCRGFSVWHAWLTEAFPECVFEASWHAEIQMFSGLSEKSKRKDLVTRACELAGRADETWLLGYLTNEVERQADRCREEGGVVLDMTAYGRVPPTTVSAVAELTDDVRRAAKITAAVKEAAKSADVLRVYEARIADLETQVSDLWRRSGNAG